MTAYLITGFIVFSIGAVGIIFRRDAISLFMCIEVMFNGVNISMASFARLWNNMDGQLAIFFIIAIAAAEAAIGFGLMLAIYKHRKSIQLAEISDLRELRE